MPSAVATKTNALGIDTSLRLLNAADGAKPSTFATGLTVGA
jgi:hypothetical protein